MKANEFAGTKQDSESKAVIKEEGGRETPIAAVITRFTRYVVVWTVICVDN